MAFILIGIAVVAVASAITLVRAVIHSEEGYEDATGYHRLKEDKTDCSAAPQENGSPWEQIDGACCPIDLETPLDQNPAHQP